MELLSNEQIALLSDDEKIEYLDLLRKIERTKKYNQLHYFEPYEFQKEFYRKGKDNPVRALIAANRCGKTFSAAMEVAIHLTGRYPEWWEGRRWDRPIRAVAAGVTSSQVKDVLQLEFLGTANRNIEEEIGTRAIPRSDIDIDKSVKGRDGSISELYVKHQSGGYSSVKFFAYSQGFEPMQGFTADIAWVDEQDKNNADAIFSELVKRTSTVQGMTICTFTPLQGVTHLVKQFWERDGDFHTGLVNAGWDDVAHLTEEAKFQMLSATPQHLRDAVTKGIPVLGAGAVFNVSEADILYDDVEIDDNWPRLCGLDIGFTNDPTAAIFCAQDPTTGVIYIYDEYGEQDNNTMGPSSHVGPLYSKGANWIPVIFDSAANAKTGASGASVADAYRDMGINMLHESFKNPPSIKNSNGSYKSIFAGLTHMQELMVRGKLKVHAKACPNWWREFRSYSYDDKGIPSADDNHWMDAGRYAVMTIVQHLGKSYNEHVGLYVEDEDNEINFY